MGTMVVGRSGWVRYEDAELGRGRAYLRYRLNTAKRWVLREVFIDSDRGDDLTAGKITQIPFVTIEAMVNNSPKLNKQMETRSKKASAIGGPPTGSNLAVLASYADEILMTVDPSEHWVAAAYLSELTEEARANGTPLPREMPRVDRRRLGHLKEEPPSEFRLSHGPGTDGLTDDFLRDVVRAYTAAVERREPPNKTLAADSGMPLRTIERWVYTARKRGAMAPGRNGSRG